MAALHDLTALEQGDLVLRGEVTPLDLVEHYLARADSVGAFVTSTPDRARAQARRLQDHARPDDAGPLWGVPTAIKDLHPTAGVRTTFGSAAYADFVPDESDDVVLTLEAAGLPSLGKTNTPEFGSPCYTEPDVAPPAVTPWDPRRTAGGSSGGAAAAVAAGLVPVAPGSDGGGSIRIPASCCGLVGLKPTRGRISAAPKYGDPVGLSTAGPLARTVRDAAALLDVMAGRRVSDPSWAPPPLGSFLAACDRDPGRLRVGRFVTPVITDSEVDPSSRAAWQETSELLANLGHEVVDIDVPLPREAVSTFELCWAVLTALSEAPAGREHQLRPLTRWLSEKGRAVSGPEFGLAIGAMRRYAAGALSA
uniref:amidase n=1 Tax=Nocardioides sp. TaxID=35761 RepID=UPI00286EAB61